MPISFSPAERKAITRRQVNILVENEAFDVTTASLAQQKAKLLEVDNANAVFFNFYDSVCRSYEDEYRKINGQVSAEFSGSDVTFAAQYGIGGIFFPNPTPAYVRSIPLIEDSPFINNTVRGLFAIVSTDASYELNILTNPTFNLSLTDLIDMLENGITGAISTTASIISFDGTSLVISGSMTNFAVGEKIFIGHNTSCGIYQITNIDLDTPILGEITITVSTLLAPASVPVTGTADNTYIFSGTERQTLVSSNWQEILTNLTNQISTRISDWDANLASQQPILTGNQEDRATQITQITAAQADISNSRSIISTWQALPDTGVGAKYTSAGIAPISAEITARQTYTSTRLTQIQVALGTSLSNALSQSGESYNSGDLTNPYYKRYVWLNIRINRSSGSLRRYYNSDQSQTQVNALKNDNNSVKGQYDAYFLTTSLSFIDGTDIVYVKSTSGYSPSDTVTVVSETQPELNLSVVSILAADTMKLSGPVPVTYQISDTARIFKTL